MENCGFVCKNCKKYCFVKHENNKKANKQLNENNNYHYCIQSFFVMSQKKVNDA